jgi:predicted dienelactone hydrolase
MPHDPALRSAMLAALLTAAASTACTSEVAVAEPKETGYGDAPSVPDASGTGTSSTDAALPDASAPRGDAGADAGVYDGDAGSDDAGTPPDAGPPPATGLSYATTREKFTDGFIHVTRPSDLAPLTAPLPVVVWANDGCTRTDAPSYPLLDRWASAGFIVISPYASPDDGLIGLIGSITTTSATDHADLIDWATSQNQSGPYAGKLDLNRIVVAGTGCGGVSALAVAAADARARAVVVVSASSSLGGITPATLRSVKAPVGFFAGGQEDTASTSVERDYDALGEGVPAIVVRRGSGDHRAVSSDPVVLGEVAEVALSWIDLVLNGNRQAYLTLTSSQLCSRCAMGGYTLASKHLETLPR